MRKVTSWQGRNKTKGRNTDDFIFLCLWTSIAIINLSALSSMLISAELVIGVASTVFFLPIYSKGKKKKLLYVWRHLWNFLQNEKKWFLQISLLPVIRFKYIQFNSFLLTTLMDLKKQGEKFRTWNKGREILMGKTFIPVNTLN